MVSSTIPLRFPLTPTNPHHLPNPTNHHLHLNLHHPHPPIPNPHRLPHLNYLLPPLRLHFLSWDFITLNHSFKRISK